VTPTNPLTPESVRAYLEQSERATEGPWEWRERRTGGDPTGEDDGLYSGEMRVHSDGSAGGEYSPDIDVFGPDAAFIAASRTMGPALAREWERMREALAPFAMFVRAFDADKPDWTVIASSGCGDREIEITLGDLRRALSTLTPTEER
jgi:hypothetical protein